MSRGVFSARVRIITQPTSNPRRPVYYVIHATDDHDDDDNACVFAGLINNNNCILFSGK